jgi:hypothetical protein
MSVVIPADAFATMRAIVASLREQSVRERLELVIVTPSPRDFDARGSELEGFHSVRVVEADTASLPRARAAGVRAAAAELVALAETHCFPDPGWAAALIVAHQGPWTAVGPVMANADSGGTAGWANFFLDYGPWAEPRPAGPMADLPGHNSCYKRAALLEYGSALEGMLDTEWVLHSDLRRRGGRLYLEPAARATHVSVSKLIPATLEWFHYSRGLATARSRRWSRPRRWLYAAGSPLIPLVRLWRTLRDVRRARRVRLLPRMLPVMALFLLGSAAGELVGYAVGGGEGVRGTTKYELHRERFVSGRTRGPS